MGCLELEALLVRRRMILQNRLADDKGQCLLPFSLFSEIQRKPLLRKKRERKKRERKKDKKVSNVSMGLESEKPYHFTQQIVPMSLLPLRGDMSLWLMKGPQPLLLHFIYSLQDQVHSPLLTGRLIDHMVFKRVQ